MLVGLGLGFRAELSPENLRFARQIGATHIVASLLNGAPTSASTTRKRAYVVSRSRPERWSEEALVRLRTSVEAEGLRLAAIESIEPADWYDVLLDGPRRDDQIANLAGLIRNLGRAGIPVLGYNFSLAGVWGRDHSPAARGGAVTWRFDDPEQPPIPKGMIWNQVYDEEAFASGATSPASAVDREEMWSRYERFLADILPVAQEAGVLLALHPEDPPLPSLRGAPRLVHRPDAYDRVLGNESPSNCMTMCIGTMSEMPDADIYASIDHLSASGRIAYVHFRNVKGKAPHYIETFVDDGDTDMLRVLSILAANGYEGVLVPDHTPELSTSAPWHAGMAYAIGWMRASLSAIGALHE